MKIIIKRKITSLSDKTKFIKDLNPKKYKENIDRILPNLKKYMKIHVDFSSENFKELFYVSKGLTNLVKEKRRLIEDVKNEEQKLIYNQILFNFSHYSGINLLIELENNLGLNTQTMEASSEYKIGEKPPEPLGALNQYTNMTSTLKEVKTISSAGINLATKLYKIINQNFLDLTKLINSDIPIFNNLIEFIDLTDIFDSTYSLDNLKFDPFEIIEESNNLINNLKDIYNGIDTGSLKRNIITLNEYIYSFIAQSHQLIYKISKKFR